MAHRMDTLCGCGYPLIWVDGGWEHDPARRAETQTCQAPNPPEMPASTVVVIGGIPRSSCCKEELIVTRVVHDTVTYHAEDFAPYTGTLSVRYAKVYPGDTDSFEVECSQCHRSIDVEVEES